MDRTLHFVTENDVLGAEPFISQLQLRGQAFVLPHQLHLLQSLTHRYAELAGLPRLGYVLMNLSRIDGRNQVVNLRETREDDAHQVGVVLLRGFQELDAGHARHLLVGYDGIKALRTKNSQRLFA